MIKKAPERTRKPRPWNFFFLPLKKLGWKFTPTSEGFKLIRIGSSLEPDYVCSSLIEAQQCFVLSWLVLSKQAGSEESLFVWLPVFNRRNGMEPPVPVFFSVVRCQIMDPQMNKQWRNISSHHSKWRKQRCLINPSFKSLRQQKTKEIFSFQRKRKKGLNKKKKTIGSSFRCRTRLGFLAGNWKRKTFPSLDKMLKNLKKNPLIKNKLAFEFDFFGHFLCLFFALRAKSALLQNWNFNRIWLLW